MNMTSEVSAFTGGPEQQTGIFGLLARFSCDGFWVTDGLGRTVWINAASERFYGVRLEEVVGRHARDLEREGVFRPSAVLVALKEGRQVTLTHCNARGKPALVTATPVLQAGRPDLVVVNVRALDQLHSEAIDVWDRRPSMAAGPGRRRGQGPWSQDLVVDDPAMARVVRLLERVAAWDVPVLLTGETGVGKNRLARQIHRISPRAGGPFIEVDVGAVPETLLESELFGYEGGAFTGARSGGKPGVFELAAGGTLVLDEICEMPVNLQAKLLRVVQERKVRRVGGVAERPVDFRLITTSNRELSALVAAGRFREDLYYRLNVVPVRIPPLRERRTAIPSLVLQIMSRLNRKYGVNREVSGDALRRLVEYRWPGNIRQLEHLLEQLVLTVDDELITAEHLPEEPVERTAGSFPDPRQIRPLREIVAEFERAAIDHAVATCGSTRAAARALGIGLATLLRKRGPRRRSLP